MDVLSAVKTALLKQVQKVGSKANLAGALPYSFSPLKNTPSLLVFVDGGDACIFASADFSLHFIRVYAGKWQGREFVSGDKKEYYVLITAKGIECFGGLELPKFNCQKEELIGMIRRYAELKLADTYDCEVVLDGNLQAEDLNLLELLKGKNALSKTNDVLSDVGSSVSLDLIKLATLQSWSVLVAPNVYFAKLHPSSKYIFKVESENEQILEMLTCQCNDPIFLGYPYGLVHADKMARVSNQERDYLRTKLLFELGEEITQHLNTKNAHDILDHI